MEFMESIVLPYIDVLPLGQDEYLEAAWIMLETGLKPSDALHAAMKRNNIQVIATENRGFDQVKFLKRLWIE